MSKKPEPPITLVVRRGALRRFDKLQRETAHLPVVVAWDRRTGERQEPHAGDEQAPVEEDRRKQPSFTWELADFVIVPGTAEAAELPPNDTAVADVTDADDTGADTPAQRASRRR